MLSASISHLNSPTPLFSHAVALSQLISRFQHSNTPLFKHMDAFTQLFHTLSIHTRHCSRTCSHFRSSTAFSHAAVLASERIFASFALSLHSHTPPLTPFFTYDRILAAFALSILTRCCYRIGSHFRSFFTHSAFPHATVLVYGRIFAAFSPSPHSHTPLFPHKIAFSHSRSILTRRCPRIQSHFHCLCSLSASHTPLFSHTIAFSLLFHPLSIHMPLFSHKIAFSLFRSIFTRRCSRIRSRFCFFRSAFPHAAVLAYDRIFAAIALSPHSHTPLFTCTNAFSLSRGILTRN